MRRILLLTVCQFVLLADVVTMKDGRQISGSLESGNTQELHVKAGDQSQTLDVHEVQTIQFGAPQAATPAKASDAAQPNDLILRDGTHVAGRWWSVDATNLHFLVNNQLQHYPRSDVLGVTFGNATLPPPPAPAPATPPPTTSAPAAPRATPAPTLARPSASAQPAASPRDLRQPEEIGMVYSWNGKVLTPLERTQAVEHKSRSAQYWEIPAPRSRVRLDEASSLVFILRLPKGVDPVSYSLFPLLTVGGARRTQSESGGRGGLSTWPVDIEINDSSSLITYALRVRDLPTGEYSFSPSASNDGYCFGVDAKPGQ
jgi:hypothetical protein